MNGNVKVVYKYRGVLRGSKGLCTVWETKEFEFVSFSE